MNGTITDQAENLRRLVAQRGAGSECRSHDSQQSVILVHGLQPGAGATTFARLCALRLQQSGQPAAHIDLTCDLETKHAGGRPQRSRGTLTQVLLGSRTLREVWSEGPAGIRMLSVDQEDLRILTDQTHRVFAEQLRTVLDRRTVVLDVADENHLRRLLPLATHCLFVTATTNENLPLVYQRIKQVANDVGRAACWLVTNHVVDRCDAEEIVAKLRVTCDRHLNLALLAGVMIPRQAGVAIPGQPPGEIHGVMLDASGVIQEIDRMISKMDLNAGRRVAVSLKEMGV